MLLFRGCEAAYSHPVPRILYAGRPLTVRMQDEWTEKYRPRSLSDIVGNEAAVRSIRRWAESWTHGVPRTKAIVLRGEPGIGKTSAALALANDMGWDFIEMNASDHRNAASIKRVAGLGATGQTFSPNGEFLSSSKGRRKLIIIDEADNLFGREDHGGAKAIVETIKEAGQPIILLVNDYRELSRKAPAVRNLADSITFHPLDRASIVSLLRRIADRERVKAPEKVFEAIAENANGDLRAAINDLQMMVEGRDSLTIEDADVLGWRNQLEELGDALRRMFEARSAKGARDATLDVDETPDDLEKWIEDGIVQEMRDPGDLENAFDALSRADIYLGRTRRLQHYGLWSYAKDLMTGGVALSRKATVGQTASEYRFPSYFILLSRAKGPRAARDSVASKLAPHFHASKRRFNESILPFLPTILSNDDELLVAIIQSTGLEEDDVAVLLGLDSDSPQVSDAMRKAKGEEHSEEKASRRKPAPSGRARRSLADY